MDIKDYQSCFTKLEVCHLGHGSLEADMAVRGKKRLEETLFTGEWTKNVTAGGCANFKGRLLYRNTIKTLFPFVATSGTS